MESGCCLRKSCEKRELVGETGGKEKRKAGEDEASLFKHHYSNIL